MREIPTLAALAADPEDLRRRAGELAARLRDAGLAVELEAGVSQVGGGSLPGEELPTTLVVLQPKGLSAEKAAQTLRCGDPSIWCRIHRDRLLFDLRAVSPAEAETLAAALPKTFERPDSSTEPSP